MVRILTGAQGAEEWAHENYIQHLQLKPGLQKIDRKKFVRIVENLIWELEKNSIEFLKLNTLF